MFHMTSRKLRLAFAARGSVMRRRWFFSATFRYRSIGHALAWPDVSDLPVFSGEIRRRPATLVGFALRRFVPIGGWLGVSAAPGPRAIFHPSPPRFIFVGELRRRSLSVPEPRRNQGRDVWLLGFAPVYGPRLAGIICRQTRRRNRSCLGLCLLQGCGHTVAHRGHE